MWKLSFSGGTVCSLPCLATRDAHLYPETISQPNTRSKVDVTRESPKFIWQGFLTWELRTSRRWEVAITLQKNHVCFLKDDLIFHQPIRGNRDPEQVKTIYQTAGWLAKAEVAPPA